MPVLQLFLRSKNDQTRAALYLPCDLAGAFDPEVLTDPWPPSFGVWDGQTTYCRQYGYDETKSELTLTWDDGDRTTMRVPSGARFTLVSSLDLYSITHGRTYSYEIASVDVL
jgi:hypothetical protein